MKQIVDKFLNMIKSKKSSKDDFKMGDLDCEIDLNFPNTGSKFNLFSNLGSLKDNKWLLGSIVATAIVTIGTGAGYYYMNTMNNSNLVAELNKKMPETKTPKKIPPAKKEKKSDTNASVSEKIVQNDKKENLTIDGKKPETNKEDVFSQLKQEVGGETNKETKTVEIKPTNEQNKPEKTFVINQPEKKNDLIVEKKNETINKKIQTKKDEKIDANKLLTKIDQKDEKQFKEKELFDEIKNDETLLNKTYLPILANDADSKKDVYALTSEELLKLNEMDEYLAKKQKYMENVTKYLDKKQKYVQALKTFDDFNEEVKNEKKKNSEEDMKRELENKIKHLETMLDTKVKDINNNIQNMTEKKVVQSGPSEQELLKVVEKKEEIKKINNETIKGFFLGGQIFSMNKEYIVAVNQGGNEIIYKKGEIILNEFLISDVTDSTITLEKNNQLYFHNVKANVGAENFVKVVVKMPMMVDNSAAEDSFNSKLVKKSATTQKVKEYVTPEERKKEEAKKFFNINPTTTKK